MVTEQEINAKNIQLFVTFFKMNFYKVTQDKTVISPLVNQFSNRYRSTRSY